VKASGRKVQVFQFVSDIDKYDVVLYLDCDILVLGRLEGILRAVRAPDKLYTCREMGPECHTHDQRFWSLAGGYTEEQVAALKRDDIGCFNAGQFVFRPTPQIAEHFAAVSRLIDDRPGGFWEQSYLNHHFNLHRAVDDTVLTPYVQLGVRRAPVLPGILLAHFSDAAMPWQHKLYFMTMFVLQTQQDEYVREDRLLI
jgi:hypothetical protein